jgi:exonuclease III
MTTLLSWNTGKEKTVLRGQVIAELASEHSLDILVFQEYSGQYINTILNANYDEIPYPGSGINRRVRIFIKQGTFKYFSIKTAFNSKLVFVHLKRLSGTEDFNIVGVHLYSKLGNTKRQQLWKNHPFVEKINEFEKTQSNNNRTIVVGDFNYCPYENDLTDPHVFNAIENRHLIEYFQLNKLGKRNHNYWYNPMWNLLGDFDYNKQTKKQATGTYFRYNKAEIPYWNLFDGLILRPSIMDRIDFANSEILTETKSTKFLKPLIIRENESFINESLSDHLPIKFTININ